MVSVMFELWQIQQWGVWSIERRDKWGFLWSDPRSEAYAPKNYTHLLPPLQRVLAEAMELAERWRMSVQEILVMPLVQYYEWLAVERARSTEQPHYLTSEQGERAWYMSQTPKMKPPRPNNVVR